MKIVRNTELIKRITHLQYRARPHIFFQVFRILAQRILLKFKVVFPASVKTKIQQNYQIQCSLPEERHNLKKLLPALSSDELQIRSVQKKSS